MRWAHSVKSKKEVTETIPITSHGQLKSDSYLLAVGRAGAHVSGFVDYGNTFSRHQSQKSG